jgi:hypothetical protein
MPITVRCRTCGALHEAGHCSPLEYPFCGPDCEKQFNRVVEAIETLMPLDMVGAKPGSKLWIEAQREISWREARASWQARDELVREYLETRPRRREPVARRYFSF